MLRLNKEYGIQIASFISGNVHLLMPSSHTSSIMIITIALSLRKDDWQLTPSSGVLRFAKFYFFIFFSNQLIILMFTYVSYFYNS